MNHIKRVACQTAWQVIAKATTSLSSLIIISAVSRRYGPFETGIFTQALTYLSFFYLASDFGFNAHLLSRLLNQSRELEWRRLLGLRIVWSIVLSIIALLLLFLIPIHNLSFDQAIIIALLAIIGSGIFTTSSALFQSRSYSFGAISSFAGSLVTLAIILYLVSNRFPIQLLFVGHMLGWLVCAGVSLVLIRRIIPQVKPIFSWQFMVTTFKEAWPISLTLLINLIYFRFDSFVLSSTQPFSEVGIYNVAYSVFQTILVVPTYIMNSYYPIMLSTLQHNLASFSPQIKRAYLGLLGLGILAMLGCLVLAPLFIQIVTSDRGFAGSVVSLQILSLGFPAFYLSSLLIWVLISLKRYRTTAIIYFLGLIINAVLNLVFIPRYSYIAASWITDISEYLILIFQLVILYPIFKDKTLNHET